MDGGSPRALEDPLQSLFKLSDDIYRNAKWSFRRIDVTIGFLLFSLFFTGLLVRAWLPTGEWKLILIAMGLLVSSLMAMMMMLRLRALLHDYVTRHAAINAVRSDPVVQVPDGDTAAERFLTHLRSKNREFRQFLVAHPESLRKPGSLSGSRSSHDFDAYVFYKGLLPKRSYMLLIRESRRMPTLKDLKRLAMEVDDISAKWKAVPSRVVLVVTAPLGDIPGDAYEVLIDGVPLRKGRSIFQVVIESSDGTYDFIPLVPEMRGFMP